MSRKVILREDQYEKLKMFFANQGKQYSYSPEKVLIVKAYLDDNFTHDPEDNIEGIGADGYVTNTPIVYMKNTFTGKKIKPMYDYQLLDLLMDKYQNMFTDDDEKMKFLGQVMKDWYNNKIGLYGSLSVNHL
jgi:hypothetical protein